MNSRDSSKISKIDFSNLYDCNNEKNALNQSNHIAKNSQENKQQELNIQIQEVDFS